MAICLDIDGVIANPYDEVNRRLSEAGYKVEDWESWTSFDLHKFYHWIPRKEISQLFKDNLVMKNAIPFEDTWLWINHMSSEDKIICITHRVPRLSRVTWEWFYDWDIPVDDILFVQDKPKALLELHKTEKVRFFVDDKPSNHNEASYAGFESYLFNRNYNRYDEVFGNQRIDSLWEVCN